ncbi:MAG: NUDIX domain-containing protein [Chloroflexota bacterium]
MKQGIVRPIAICVFRHNGRILVAEGYNAIKHQRFYRPLGGTIEFGEPSADTIVRELREELSATVGNLRYLGTLENIFSTGEDMGHEIVLVYDGEFLNPALYELEAVEGVEEDGTLFRVVWLRLTDCLAPATPSLYPAGLFELLETAA